VRGAALLTVLGVALFAAFWVQRARSSFLHIEAEVDLAERVAADAGLTAEEVMALRELAGADVDEVDLRDAARAFAQGRRDFGHEDLAVLVVIGRRELAERLLRDADGRVDDALLELRGLPEAFFPVRFRAMRDRFAERRAD
jgi:hypothetical protein